MYSVYIESPTIRKTVLFQSENYRSARSSAGKNYYRKHHQRIDTTICDDSGKILLKLEAKFK